MDLLKGLGDGSLSYLDLHVELNTRRGKYILPSDVGVEQDTDDGEE